jgi:hypothetical protein
VSICSAGVARGGVAGDGGGGGCFPRSIDGGGDRDLERAIARESEAARL